MFQSSALLHPNSWVLAAGIDIAGEKTLWALGKNLFSKKILKFDALKSFFVLSMILFVFGFLFRASACCLW